MIHGLLPQALLNIFAAQSAPSAILDVVGADSDAEAIEDGQVNEDAAVAEEKEKDEKKESIYAEDYSTYVSSTRSWILSGYFFLELVLVRL